MKSLLFTALILAICTIHLYSQDKPADLDPSEHFIYLFDNTLLKEGDFEIKKGLLTRRFYYPDGEKIKYNTIKFFQDKRGYFGNYRGKSKKGLEIASRIETGAIDLFVKTHYDRHSGTSKHYYFAKGFGDLQILNYKNLKQTLALNQTVSDKTQFNLALSHLERGKKDNKTSRILLISGLSTFLVGTLIYASDKEKGQEQGYSSKQITGLTIGSVGIVTSLTAMFFNPRKSYLNAIREYNKMR